MKTHLKRLMAARTRRTLSAQDAIRLIDLTDAGDRAVWATAVFAGLRPGELTALSVDSINLEQGTIAVRRSYDPRHGCFTSLKSGHGGRRVTILAPLWPYLQRAIADAVPSPQALVWGGVSGEGVLDTRALTLRARRAWAAASVEPITLPTARTTCAFLLFARGYTVLEVSQMMGFASVEMAVGLYRRIAP